MDFFSEDPDNKLAIMGLNEHLQTSIMTGLIGKYRGASNYLNDKTNTLQASRILVLRLKSRKERLNWQDTPNKYAQCFVAGETEATHVVVGITYGAEAYCVLTQELNLSPLDDGEAQEEARDEAKNNLSVWENKLLNAWEERQNVEDFQKGFNEDEEQSVARIKCRLYADLQTQAIRECTVINAYTHCMNLIEQFQQKTEGKEIQPVPISITLCPLKHMVRKAKEGAKLLRYRDVDSGLVSRCCHILTELVRIIDEATAIRAAINRKSRKSLRQFVKFIDKFQSLLKKDLKVAVIKARESEDGDEEVAIIIDVAEKHILFKPSRLDRWLEYKNSELKMVEKTNKTKGIITLFPSLKLLKNKLVESENKYALVLSIPPVDKWTREILANMKTFVKMNQILSVQDSKEDGKEKEDEAEDETDRPWHMDARRRKQVLDEMRKLAKYADKNKHLENQVQFLMVIGDSCEGPCRYSVYESDNVLKEHIDQLPRPTGLKITAKTSSSVHVEWNHEELGFPFQHYIVEYRLINDDRWKEQKINKPGEHQMAIDLNEGSDIEIRLAMDTCIGRSEFSDTIRTDSEVNYEESNNHSQNVTDTNSESKS